LAKTSVVVGMRVIVGVRAYVRPFLNIGPGNGTMWGMAEEFEQPIDGTAEFEAEEEAVDVLPVLAEVRPIEPTSQAILPAVQAAAAAATGFVAGAATFALVRRRAARKLARAQAGALVPRRTINGMPVSGTRTFLVHVHVIGRSTD
jgi:hypothetical protein